MDLLHDTFSADPSLRQAAENLLHTKSTLPGFLPALLTQTTSTDHDAALAAALYVKNFVRRHWDALDEQDRAAFRGALVTAMARVSDKVRAQLAEAMKRVVSADFPVRYPRLIPEIMAALSSDNDRDVESALIALRALAKVYEFRGPAMEKDEDVKEWRVGNVIDYDYLHRHPRAALNYIVDSTFPTLLSIFQRLETTIMNRDIATFAQGDWDRPFEIQRTITKVFWSLTHYDLPKLLVNDLTNSFTRWMEVFQLALRRPVVAREAMSEEELRKVPQWKVKQWVGHIVYRLFQRYCNPSRLHPGVVRSFDEETIIRFGDFFRRTFAPGFTETMLELLSWDPRKTSPRVANMALLYLEAAVSPSLTFKVIRPRLAHLVIDIIFPYLCIHESDLQIWAEDPIEYVRKSYDVAEDFDSPRAAACTLLYQMAKQRRSLVVAPLMHFLLQILESYSGTPNTVENREQRALLARQKDGALLAIGTIRESLTSSPDSTSDLEKLLSTYVIPDFTSDFPFLRARACWLYGQLTAAESIAIDAILPGLVGVQACIRDPEFPVRVRAAVDIRHFLQNRIAAERIAPNLQDLLQLLFALLDNVDNTDIVATIDQVVVGYSDLIAPHAAPLCARLVVTFSRAASVGQSDDEAGFAATQCIQALESIVTSVALSRVENKEKLLDEIEEAVKPVFEGMFSEDRIEYFEESLELLATFVYHSSEERHGSVITPYLWSLFPRAMQAFHDWAADYSFHYLHLLDSYITKSGKEFCERGNAQLLVGMVTRLWEEPVDDDVAIQGGRVVSLYVQHCRKDPSFDGIIGSLAHLTATRIMGSSGQTAVLLIRTLAHLTFVSPISASQVIDSNKVLPMWLSALREGLLDGYDAKASALALCAMLRVIDYLPLAIRSAKTDLLVCVRSLLKECANAEGEFCVLANVDENEYFDTCIRQLDVEGT